jgi:hypothetical protein
MGQGRVTSLGYDKDRPFKTPRVRFKAGKEAISLKFDRRDRHVDGWDIASVSWKNVVCSGASSSIPDLTHCAIYKSSAKTICPKLLATDILLSNTPQTRRNPIRLGLPSHGRVLI